MPDGSICGFVEKPEPVVTLDDILIRRGRMTDEEERRDYFQSLLAKHSKMHYGGIATKHHERYGEYPPTFWRDTLPKLDKPSLAAELYWEREREQKRMQRAS